MRTGSPAATQTDPAEDAGLEGFGAAHLRAILANSVEYAFIAMDAQRRVTGWSPGAEALMGWREAEMLGRPADRVYTPEDRAAGVPGGEAAKALAEGRARDERWHLRRDGSRFWAVGELVSLGKAPPGGFVKILRDHTERKRAEELNRAISEHAPDGLFLLDPEGRVTLANPAGLRLLGWAPGELDGRVLHEAAHHHHPDGTPYAACDCPLARAHRSGVVLQGYATTFFRKDGTPVPVVCSSAPIHGRGEVVGSVQVVHDVTERRRAEEHQRLLVGELNHRVKNTLATVQAMAVQSVRSARTPQDVRDALEPRLLMLAKAHDILTHESWEGADLRDLVTAAVDLHQAEGLRRFKTRGPGVRLEPRVALALTLALHELATNAVKYGALSNETGCVEIDWTVGGVYGRHLILEWRESGGPPVAPPTRKGFGSRLIERSLAGEIAGEVRMTYAPEGFICTIGAPLGAAGAYP